MSKNSCNHKFPDGSPSLYLINKEILHMVYPKWVYVGCEFCDEIIKMKEEDLPQELKN